MDPDSVVEVNFLHMIETELGRHDAVFGPVFAY
jgi:hypothetical protein